MPDYRSREERRKAQAKNKGNSKKQRSLFKKILLAFCIFIAICIVGGGIAVFAVVKSAPELNPDLLHSPLTTIIYDKNGNEVATVFNKHKRISINIQDVPPLMKKAVISIEDRRFKTSIGIDFRRILGAAIADIKQGRLAEGGSTISQQLVKRTMLTSKKTFTRKIQGAWLAIQLNQRYSKPQILEMYLNNVYYGEGAYGLGTAAKVYFNKPIQDLNLSQMALLAGLPNAPSALDPYDHPKNAADRRNQVLHAMVETGAISKDQAQKAASKSVKSLLAKKEPDMTKNQTPYYGAFVNLVKHELVDKRKVISKKQFTEGGLKIYTTLDPEAQKEIYQLQHSADYPDKYFNTGITLMDTQTGAVRAIGGGRDFTTYRSGTNFALTKTDIGSTAKPVIDYGPAIEYLKWSTYHPIEDKPFKYKTGDPLHDWDFDYMGRMTLRDALAYSRNIPAVKTYYSVVDAVGKKKTLDFARNLGLTFKHPEENQGSVAIGSFSPGASTLQMAGAYAAFGNEGVYHKPFAVTKIEFPNGKTEQFHSKPDVVMHDYTSYMITDMLKSVIDYGTARTMDFPSDMPVAGKTGSVGLSSQYNIDPDKRPLSDEWFVGYTPQYSLAIWTGYSDVTHGDQVYYIPGASSTGDIAKEWFQQLITDLSSDNLQDWQKPDSVVKVPIEKDTGKLASDYTPESDIAHALFVKGTQPTEVSKKYKKPDTPQNLQANYDEKKQDITVTWDYPKKGTFRVSYSVDGQSMKTLGTTHKTKLVVDHPQPGSTYKFQIVAVNGDKKSDPATASVTVPGISLAPPNGLHAKYDKKHNIILLSWHAPKESQGETYQVSYSTSGGTSQTLGSTSQTQVVINNPQPGETYTFSVVAIQGDAQSDPAETTVTVPATSESTGGKHKGQGPPPPKKDGGGTDQTTTQSEDTNTQTDQTDQTDQTQTDQTNQ
ncbi:MAG TPA: PBP1A family penicillin-binding protein [Bacillales bacterium]|nr:PBP1A family penicillin-binding protein [Bacillales bacterium]